MSNRQDIVNLPPTSNIQDPAVRKFLDALVNQMSVRNGQTRNDGARFITADELEGAMLQAINGESTSGKSNTLANAFFNLIKYVKK